MVTLKCLNPDYCGTGDADTICKNCLPLSLIDFTDDERDKADRVTDLADMEDDELEDDEEADDDDFGDDDDDYDDDYDSEDDDDLDDDKGVGE